MPAFQNMKLEKILKEVVIMYIKALHPDRLSMRTM
jgi:hypothetical protein